MATMKKFISFVFVSAAFGALYGAGFQIVEQGAANIGTAMAGASADANGDASIAYWNPSAAAFSNLKEGETVSDTVFSFIMPNLEFNDDGSSRNPFGSKGSGDGGNCSQFSCVPNLFMLHRFSEDFTGTLSFTAPFGLESDYASNWVGSYQALNSFLMTLDLNPSFVYKVNDWFSIGLGVSGQYLHVKLTQDIFLPGMGTQVLKAKGDSFGVGGNAGFTIKYADDGRIGVNWRSEVYHSIDGDSRIGGNRYHDVESEVNLPAQISAGWYQRLRGDFKEFAVMAEYAYIFWSSFERLGITDKTTGSGLLGDPGVYEGWKDTSRVSLGFHYYPEYFKDCMTVRIGACFDESPVKSPELRTARIPCCDRVWLSAGLGFSYKNLNVGVSYSYIFLVGNSDINSTLGSSVLKGYYTGHIQVVSLQVGWKF